MHFGMGLANVLQNLVIVYVKSVYKNFMYFFYFDSLAFFKQAYEKDSLLRKRNMIGSETMKFCGFPTCVVPIV